MPRLFFAALSVTAALLVLTRCSGPAQVQPPAPAEQPAEPAPLSGPAYRAVYFNADGLQQHDLRTDETTLLIHDADYRGTRAVSPGGRLLAVAYAYADSSKLALVDLLNGTVRDLHATPDSVVYTLAWSSEGTELAFGFYAEKQLDYRVEMGAGDIRIVATDGTAARSVGCSTSKAVVNWHTNGDLVVKDNENLYVVDPSDCQTLATIPHQKKHHLTFSADGQWMAYIFRELAYNRSARSYEPESTLYVADYRGEDERKVIDQKYHPKHMAWSPDGPELAFDVQSQDDSTLRHISIYDLTEEVSAYLVPPSTRIPSRETHPVWSPTGRRIAFDKTLVESPTYQKLVRTFVEQTPRTIASSSSRAELGTTWGWAGDDALVLSSGKTATALDVTGDTLFTLPPHRALLYIQPLQEQ